jgi:hypothetical protein
VSGVDDEIARWTFSVQSRLLVFSYWCSRRLLWSNARCHLYRLSISRPSFVRNRGPTTAIRTCVTSLPRRSKSAAASDAIRHMQVTDMEESAKIWKQEAHAFTPPFRASSLCAPGSRSSGSTRPADSDRDMSLPGWCFVGCCLWEQMVSIFRLCERVVCS